MDRPWVSPPPSSEKGILQGLAHQEGIPYPMPPPYARSRLGPRKTSQELTNTRGLASIRVRRPSAGLGRTPNPITFLLVGACVPPDCFGMFRIRLHRFLFSEASEGRRSRMRARGRLPTRKSRPREAERTPASMTAEALATLLRRWPTPKAGNQPIVEKKAAAHDSTTLPGWTMRAELALLLLWSVEVCSPFVSSASSLCSPSAPSAVGSPFLSSSLPSPIEYAT